MFGVGSNFVMITILKPCELMNPKQALCVFRKRFCLDAHKFIIKFVKYKFLAKKLKLKFAYYSKLKKPQSNVFKRLWFFFRILINKWLPLAE